MSSHDEGKEEGKKEKEEDKLHFDWKDIFAFSVAGCQVILPQLLILLASIIVVAVLLFYFWLN